MNNVVCCKCIRLYCDKNSDNKDRIAIFYNKFNEKFIGADFIAIFAHS